jgi:2,3-bisphosphoglycerate-independent phosphoglycerate mutase
MNYANADMVGHSGNLLATVKACETVDECLGRLFQALKNLHSRPAWFITADHGNAEMMIDQKTGGPHTYHTTNPVPFILASDEPRLPLRADGSLRDIAPTILGVLGLAQPPEMTGRDLRLAPK